MSEIRNGGARKSALLLLAKLKKDYYFYCRIHIGLDNLSVQNLPWPIGPWLTVSLSPGPQYFGRLPGLVQQERAEIYNMAEDSFITSKGWIEAFAELVGVEPRMIFVESIDVGFQPRQWFPFRDTHLFGSVNNLKRQLCIESKIGLVQGLGDTYGKLNQVMLRQPVVHSE